MSQPWLIILVAAAGVTVAKVLPAFLPTVGETGPAAPLMRYLPAAILGAVTASGIAELATGSGPPWGLYVVFVIVAAVAALTRRIPIALGLGAALVVAAYLLRLV